MENPSHKIIFIYTTFPEINSARLTAKKLLEEKLIACANVFPEMYSSYWWEGKLEEAKEVVAIFKTTADYFSQCEMTIKLLHPYSIPCLLEIEIPKGNPDYMNWIKEALLTNKK